MKKTVEVVHSTSGDWAGLYVNGELQYEGHEIPLWELAEAIGCAFVTFKERTADGELAQKIDRSGRMPEQIEDP